MDAGDYYYFISDMCTPLGPIDDEAALNAITPDVKLFEITPAGISDYYIHMNTQALSNYAQEGIYLLEQLEEEQAYTAGANPQNPKQIFHDFMLQREVISFSQLVSTLNNFSQEQTLKGQYYRKLLSSNDRHARFKAVTSVRLIEVENSDVMFLSQYKSNYYRLNKQGETISPAFMSVNHRTALTRSLHPATSKWSSTTINGVCGKKL